MRSDIVDYERYSPSAERYKRYIQYPVIEEPPKPKREPIQWQTWIQPSQQIIDATKEIYSRTVHVPITQYLIIFFLCVLSGIMTWNIINLYQTHQKYQLIANTYNYVVEENNRLNQIFFESYDRDYLYDVVEKFSLIPIEDAEQYIID